MAKPFAMLVALLKHKRTWLQFRLRSLFLVVLMATIPCVLLKAKVDHKAKERRAVAEIKKLGGKVWYDWEAHRKKEPPGFEWLRKLLGDDYWSNVLTMYIESDAITDEWLVNLEPLTDLEIIYLESKQITDAGMVHIMGMKKLEILDISNTPVTEVGIANIRKALPNCRTPW